MLVLKLIIFKVQNFIALKSVNREVACCFNTFFFKSLLEITKNRHYANSKASDIHGSFSSYFYKEKSEFSVIPIVLGLNAYQDVTFARRFYTL